jgi:parallel beta-helix repeat protein
MSYQRLLKQILLVVLFVLSSAGCGASVPTPVSEAPTATLTPKLLMPTPTPVPPTATPGFPTATSTPISPTPIPPTVTRVPPTAAPSPIPSTSTPVPPTATPTETPSLSINRTTSGRMTQNEIWRGDILITGDIEIPQGVTLIIEPGTTIRFTAQSDDQRGGGTRDLAEPERVYFPDDPPAIPANMIGLIVFGSLNAQGTIDQPITFSSDSDTSFVNDWQSIAVEAGGMAILDHVIMEYNYWGLQLNTNTSKATVTNSTFRHIATCGVCTGPHPIAGPIIISNNLFTDCGHEGVDTYQDQNLTIKYNLFIENVVGVVANGSTVTIEANTFRNNHRGINPVNGGNPTIVGNEITQNTFAGIWIWEGSSASLTGNNIYDNAMNVGLGRSNQNLNAENNWWGVTDSSTIEKLVQDGKDESGLGIVNFEPYAMEPFILDSPK